MAATARSDNRAARGLRQRRLRPRRQRRHQGLPRARSSIRSPAVAAGAIASPPATWWLQGDRQRRQLVLGQPRRGRPRRHRRRAIADTTANVTSKVAIGNGAQVTLIADDLATPIRTPAPSGSLQMQSDQNTLANNEIKTSAFGAISGIGASARNDVNAGQHRRASATASIINGGQHRSALGGQPLHARPISAPISRASRAAPSMRRRRPIAARTCRLNTLDRGRGQRLVDVVSNASPEDGGISLADLQRHLLCHESIAYKGGGVGLRHRRLEHASTPPMTPARTDDNGNGYLRHGADRHRTRRPPADSNIKISSTGDVQPRRQQRGRCDRQGQRRQLRRSRDRLGRRKSVLKINPVHQITVGGGAEIKALRHVRMLTGMDDNFTRDQLQAARPMPTRWPAASIPLDKVRNRQPPVHHQPHRRNGRRHGADRVAMSSCSGRHRRARQHHLAGQEPELGHRPRDGAINSALGGAETYHQQWRLGFRGGASTWMAPSAPASTASSTCVASNLRDTTRSEVLDPAVDVTLNGELIGERQPGQGVKIGDAPLASNYLKDLGHRRRSSSAATRTTRRSSAF